MKLLNDLKTAYHKQMQPKSRNLQNKSMQKQKRGNRNERKQLHEPNKQPKQKRVRAAAVQDVEKALLLWFRQTRNDNISIKHSNFSKKKTISVVV